MDRRERKLRTKPGSRRKSPSDRKPIPLGQVLRDLQPLLAHPQEDLDIEIKGWLNLSDEEHRADLAKALLALANHGGGHVILGFTEKDGVWVPEEPRPGGLAEYSQDVVNGIVHRYADPPFHCAVFHVPHPSTGRPFPIIQGSRRA